MGIGMVLVVAAADLDKARATLVEAGEANSVVIGEIVAGGSGVEYT
jgi:phosphoribosylaminoimidazole (AIR) synthetase